MRLLIDTCALLWAMGAPERLSPRVRFLFEDAANEILVSAASAWEIAIKRRAGRLELSGDTATVVHDAIRLYSLTVLPVSVDHALAAGALPLHHADPFDRMLIAQAATEGVPLASPDRHFAAYPIETVW